MGHKGEVNPHSRYVKSPLHPTRHFHPLLPINVEANIACTEKDGEEMNDDINEKRNMFVL